MSGLFKNAAWSFTPALLQPLFDSRRNRTTLTQQGPRVRLRWCSRTRGANGLSRGRRCAGRRATLGDQLAALLALADAEVRRLELAVLLFRGGVASPQDRLEVKRSALAAQQAVVQLRLARLQNAVLALPGRWRRRATAELKVPRRGWAGARKGGQA